MLGHLKSSKSPMHATMPHGTRTPTHHSVNPRQSPMLDNPAGGGGMPLPPEPMQHMHSEPLPTIHTGRGLTHQPRVGASPISRKVGGGFGF